MTTIPPPKFEDLMKRYHGEIERLVYAAEIHCQGKDRKGTPSCPFYSCPFNDPWNMLCRIERIRLVMGEHQPVGDPAPYCIPCERTMPECGECKGPAEIGQCPNNGPDNGCHYDLPCNFKKINQSLPCGYECGREDAALAACEQYQQEDRR